MARHHNAAPNATGYSPHPSWRARLRSNRAKQSLFVFLLLAVAHPLWLPLIGRALVVADPLQPADALVPLAGERIRVDYTASLFQQKYAPWFVVTDAWISPADPPLVYANSVTDQAVGRGVARDRIVVAPGMPDTTYTEAVSIRELAQQRGWRSIIVVTSPYHTWRSRIILQDVFRDTGINVSVHPVGGHWYNPDSWWMSSSGWMATVSEYWKFGLYLIGIR